MKIRILLYTLLLLFVFNTNSYAKNDRIEFRFMGIKTEEITWKNVGKTTLGVIASLIIHEAGHIGYAEYKEMKYELDLNSKHLVSMYMLSGSGKEMRQCARAGFLFQSIFNMALTHSKWRNGYFVKGAVSTQAIQLLTYNSRGNKDFDTIDKKGGNEDQDYFIFGAITLYNIGKLSITKQ